MDDIKEEVKNAEVENETIEVNVPKEDKTDISDEECISMNTVSKDSEEVKKITEEQKEYLLKRAKESNIDWNTIDFEEDGVTPKVTDEEINVFAAVASEFFDYDTISLYIEQAKIAIEDYKTIKAQVDANNEVSTDDLEYYKMSSQGYEDARIVLAMLQQESRRLEKEFKDSKIAEDFIKGVTLKTLRDVIIDNYKLSDSWYNPEKKSIEELDKTKEIENSLMNKMFVTTYFRQMVKRYLVKSRSSQMYNLFGEKICDDMNNFFVQGLQTYVNNLKSHDNVDIKTVITRDFKCLDFINATVLFPMIYHNDTIISDINFSEEERKLFATKLNPNNYYTEVDSDKIYDKVYDNITKIIDSLINVSNVERMLQITKENLKADKKHNKIYNGSIDIEDYPNYIAEIAKSFPNVDGIKLMNWGSVYSYMNKYEIFITYSKLYGVLTDSSKNEIEKRKAGFNALKSILGQMYMCFFGEIITNLENHVKENCYTKEPRSTLFGMALRSLIIQHELGYKADFIPNETSSGDVLYEKAKEIFGKEYDYMVGEKENDILLKNVDLTEVRKDYVLILNDMLILIKENLDNIFNDSYISFKNNFDNELNAAKKNKKRRR